MRQAKVGLPAHHKLLRPEDKTEQHPWHFQTVKKSHMIYFLNTLRSLMTKMVMVPYYTCICLQKTLSTTQIRQITLFPNSILIKGMSTLCVLELSWSQVCWFKYLFGTPSTERQCIFWWCIGCRKWVCSEKNCMSFDKLVNCSRFK